jgi:ABC-type nickel/cobalt efflux system permease component RcnA
MFVLMKNFWLLFSMLILMLSVLPCRDAVEHKEHVKAAISNHENHDGQDNHNHDAEHCAPFCRCACCGVQFLHFEMQLISFKENYIFAFQKDDNDSFETIFIQKIASKIWQPPKINV